MFEDDTTITNLLTYREMLSNPEDIAKVDAAIQKRKDELYHN